MDHCSGIDYEQRYTDVYKELSIPPDDKGMYAMDSKYLHIWPRREFILIALPNLDKSFTATLFMPKKRFRAIENKNQLLTFFKDNFPDVIPLIGEEKLYTDFFRNNTSNLNQ